VDVLITYDINTETKEGRRRLRNVATACKDFGQRVQYSVFECQVTEAQFESLRARLLKIIYQGEDNLRIYRLCPPRDRNIESYGRDSYVSYDDPLVY
jgi:CRISPR-associated protein Cas2